MESETSIDSALLLYILSFPTPSPVLSSPLPIDSLPSYHTMSQHNLYAIIRQQQKQLAVMQAQIQALIAGGAGAKRRVEGSNTESHMEVARPSIFSREVGKVGGFIMACKLYLRMQMKEAPLEKQIQWILSYVQEGLVDIWKENVLEDLEEKILEYETVGEFFADIRKEFGRKDKKAVKMAELKRLEQGGRMMEEFVQEFRRAVRGSGYERRPLIEEFKRGMSEPIRRKLMEAKRPSTNIEQWYKHTINLDRH